MKIQKKHSLKLGYWLFCIYIFLAYTRPQDVWPWLEAVHLAQILAGIILFLVVNSREWERILPMDRLTRAVLIFFGIMWFSLVNSIWRGKTLEICMMVLPSIITYLLMIVILRNKERLSGFLSAIIGGTFIVSLAQIYVYYSIGANQITGRGGYGFDFGWAGGGERGYAYGVGGYGNGFLANSSDLGVGLLVALPLTYGLMKISRSKRMQVFLAICCISFLASIILTGSRGAFLGLLAMGAGIVAQSRRKIGVVLFLSIIAVGAFLIAPGNYLSRVKSIGDYEKDESANIRLELWKSGLRIFLDNPLTGVGAGNFPTAYGLKYHEVKEGGVIWWNPHNIFIHILSELGLLGFSSYLYILVAIVRKNREIGRITSKGGEEISCGSWLIKALNLSVLGYVSSGCFITATYFPHLFLLAGLSGSLARTFFATPSQARLREEMHSGLGTFQLGIARWGIPKRK